MGEPGRRRMSLSGIALRGLSALCGALAGLMDLRFLFRLLIANPANPVTSVIYAASGPFLFPWPYLWPLSELPGMVVERATVAALGIYLALGLLLGLVARSCASSATRNRHQGEER